MTRNANERAVVLVDRFDGIRLVDGHRCHVKRAGIDVPRIVVLRRVLEELELIAAAPLATDSNRQLCEAGDTARSLVDRNLTVDSQMRLSLLTSRDAAPDAATLCTGAVG